MQATSSSTGLKVSELAAHVPRQAGWVSKARAMLHTGNPRCGDLALADCKLEQLHELSPLRLQAFQALPVLLESSAWLVNEAMVSPFNFGPTLAQYQRSFDAHEQR